MEQVDEAETARNSGAEPPCIWAVVLNWCDAPAAIRCIEHLERATYPRLEILMVDNGSPDGSGGELERRFPNHHFLETGENLGYAGGNSAGMLYAIESGADGVLIINPDCVVDAGFLEPLVEELVEHPRTGAVGPVQLNKDDGGLLWANGGSHFDLSNSAIHPDGPSGPDEPRREGRFPVGFVCGACILLRAAAVEEVGPFDSRLFLFSEEPDWCLRAARAGWETVTVASSVVEHSGSESTSGTRRAAVYLINRNACWVARRFGTKREATFNSLGALFWRMPHAFFGHLSRRRFDLAMASTRGYLAGVFGDCRRSSDPYAAAAERRYELAP